MKKLILFIFVFTGLQFQAMASDDFYNTPTKFKLLRNTAKTIEVYPNWSDSCTKGHESVSYTYYDNQTDDEFIGSCAVTYTYAKCTEKDPDCKQTKVKFVSKDKVISTSLENRSDCSQKKTRLVTKLKDLGFKCKGSGIN